MTWPEIGVFDVLCIKANRLREPKDVAEVSSRELAKIFNCSRNTVRSALNGLEAMKYIESHEAGWKVLNFNGSAPVEHPPKDVVVDQEMTRHRGSGDEPQVGQEMPHPGSPPGPPRITSGTTNGTKPKRKKRVRGAETVGDCSKRVGDGRKIFFERGETAKQSNFVGPGVEEVKKTTRAEYLEEFGDAWLWATWLKAVRYAFRNRKWIEAKKDLAKTLENWFDNEAAEDRKRGK